MENPTTINYCGVCGDQPGPVSTVCKPCRKAARATFSDYVGQDQFMEHECRHLERNPKLAIARFGPSKYNIPYPHLNTLGRPKSRCALCLDEMRKELAQRYKKGQSFQVNRQRVTESLFTKCCRVVATDPGLLLMATAHQPPIPESVWKDIYNEVPTTLSKEFNEALDESRAVNDAYWMYRTLGEVFSRYRRRTRGRF